MDECVHRMLLLQFNISKTTSKTVRQKHAIGTGMYNKPSWVCSPTALQLLCRVLFGTGSLCLALLRGSRLKNGLEQQVDAFAVLTDKSQNNFDYHGRSTDAEK